MFAPAECAALLALPEAERLPSFLWYWARKEAVVKAIGRGLSYSLQAFVLSAEPGEAPERLRLECEGSDVAVWVRTLPGLPGGYTAAVASSFAPGALRVERWEDPG
jgi:4'-phosphopantetheinyl transferase